MVQHIDLGRHNDAVQLAKGLLNVSKTASRQQTSNSGSVFVNAGNVDENGRDLAQGTIINGAGGGFAPFVNDTTPPGKPTGISVASAASMIAVTWDGTLEGGIPSDFSHLAVYIDSAHVGDVTSKGTNMFGPYEVGSSHTVQVGALDDAHNDKGESTPNESTKTAGITIVVAGSDIDTSKLGITVTKTTTDPSDKGSNKGDLWLKYDKDPSGENPALLAEWWWDGTQWAAIPIAVYLDQLASRGVTADSAVIGLLSAGIIQSGTFRTAESGARVEIDMNGIREYDSNGNTVANIPSNGGGVNFVGRVSTGLDGGNHAVLETRETEIGHTGSLTFLLNGSDPSGMPCVSGIGESVDGDTRILSMSINPAPHDKAIPAAVLVKRSDEGSSIAISSGETVIKSDTSVNIESSTLEINSYDNININSHKIVVQSQTDQGLHLEATNDGRHLNAPVYINGVRSDIRVTQTVSDVITLDPSARDVTLTATRVAGICILSMAGDSGNHSGGHSIGVLKTAFLPVVGNNALIAPAYNWAIANFQSARLFTGDSGKTDGTLELYSNETNQRGFSFQFIYPLRNANL